MSLSPTVLARPTPLTITPRPLEQPIELDITEPLEETGCCPAKDLTPFKSRVLVNSGQNKLVVFENKVSWIVREIFCCCRRNPFSTMQHAETIQRYECYLSQKRGPLTAKLIPFVNAFDFIYMKVNNLPLRVGNVKLINHLSGQWKQLYESHFIKAVTHLKYYLLLFTPSTSAAPSTATAASTTPSSSTRTYTELRIDNGYQITVFDEERLTSCLKQMTNLADDILSTIVTTIRNALWARNEEVIPSYVIVMEVVAAMLLENATITRPDFAEALEKNLSEKDGMRTIERLKKEGFLHDIELETLECLYLAYMAKPDPNKKTQFTIPPPFYSKQEMVPVKAFHKTHLSAVIEISENMDEKV